jgi:phage recombination protein Bet
MSQTQQRSRQAMTAETRFTKHPDFHGTATAWRVLVDLYPAAESSAIIMAVLEYCAVRKLDPFKRPVHIVKMWNPIVRREVQQVMRSIDETEITAHRTGQWAGMDPPVWGPMITRTFRGMTKENDKLVNVEVTMNYPASCSVTVYRLVAGERRAFTEELYWDESYSTAGFRSEMPNARWQKAPRQMLHKCTKAAVLRAAFPEEVGHEYTAEEMEGKSTDGGITIEGHAETPELQRERFPEEPESDEEPDPTVSPGLAEMLAEVRGMDLVRIAELGTDRKWRARIDEMFPLDADQVREATRVRIAELREGEKE